MDKNKSRVLVSVAAIAFFMAIFLPAALASSQSPPDFLYLGSLSAPRFSPSTINAGDIVTMNIDVTSSAVYLNITDVNAVLELSNYFEPLIASDNIGTLVHGATGTFLLKFKVNEATPPGFYTINLKLTYLRDKEPVSQTQTISVPVSVGQKNLIVSLNPKTISPGNQTTLSYSITNNSLTSVSNVLFTWSESTGLVLPLGSDNRKFISRIDSGATADINYLVAVDPNIATGIYPLDIEISYNDSNGPQIQKSTIGIIAGGATDFDVSSDYTSGQVSFSIANIGSNNAAAVVVKLIKQTGLTISGSDTVVIGALNKGDYSIANFTVQNGFGDLNSASSANGFRRGVGTSTASPLTASQSTQNASASGADNNLSGAPSGGFNGTVSQGQAAAPYVVDIYYTDTTGERQHVQKNFTLSARTTGLTVGTTAGGFSGSGQSTDLVLIGALFAIIIAVGAIYNKKKAKKDWKSFAIISAVGIILAVIILELVPRTYLTTVLSAVFLAGLVVMFFAMRGK